MLCKRYLCTQTAAGHHTLRRKWPIKQITKSNYDEELTQLKSDISNSNFVAVSLQKTGGHSPSWQRTLPIDTEETAYLKAKYVANRVQILQFAVCPFSVQASKLIAHPYNFHLFPRDELKIGMPSYSFSCQSSYLSVMAQEGFDFNSCIHEGISYLSREQESATKVQMGHSFRSISAEKVTPINSVADTLFKERIKSRVISWVKSCKASNKPESDLVSCLRKILSGTELYGSRPCVTVDVTSERQVNLALEALQDVVDVVPLRVPTKGGGVQAVRVVLMSSEEDRHKFEMELKNTEEEQTKRIRGFREVIDLVSASQKLVLVHNSLNDFSFIHSKFLGTLPPTLKEFKNSLHSAFPNILDVNNLMNEVGPFKKINNIPATLSYLKRSAAPVIIEVPNRENIPAGNDHGHDVLEICELFVKLCSVLKISPEFGEGVNFQSSYFLQSFTNAYTTLSNSFTDSTNKEVGIWKGKTKRVSINNLVFLWGFKGGISAVKLKQILHHSHGIFSDNFDVRMLDKTCALVSFSTPGHAERFLGMFECERVLSEKLKDLISEGLRATGYETYRRACALGFSRLDLAECLDNVLEESEALSGSEVQKERFVLHWNSEEMINLDDVFF